jgi:hypothetical protein
MNILFPTQSGGLQMFHLLGQALKDRTEINRLGFTVADRWYYSNWIKDNQEFEESNHLITQEWDITTNRQTPPDMTKLAKYETMLAGPNDAGPGLFGAIVADRRLLMGPDCSYSQDYRRRFSDTELLRILQNGCEAMEKMFDDLKPDLVVGFVCVSILEYLAFLFAKARGIRYLNIRTSRIGNRILLADTHRDPAAEVATALATKKFVDTDIKFSQEWIHAARFKDAKYEGVSSPSAQPAQKFGIAGGKLGAPLRFLKRLKEYKACGAAEDNHSPGLIRPAIFKLLINPMRARQAERTLRSTYITANELKESRYAVFPLHTEPEMSLLLYGRPYVNQMELLRAIALSLPADMVLVVKEHPWMVGKRSISAYRKFLNIPRLRLAAPEVTVRALIENAALCCVHTGSSWWEATVLKIPVLALGPIMGELLPEGMVRRCRDLTLLPETIATLLSTAKHQEKQLEDLVAAISACTIPINLYTGLLERAAYRTEDIDRDQELARMSDFILKRMNEANQSAPTNIQGGSW